MANTSKQQMQTNENRRENNGHAYHGNGNGSGGMTHRRLVDVGSQTSYELQTPSELASVNKLNDLADRHNSHIEPYEMKSSHLVPTISHVALGTNTNTKTKNTKKLEATSRGYVSAFNSLATIAVPDIQKYKQPIPVSTSTNKLRDRGCIDRSQSIKHTFQQRHDRSTAAAASLVKQPISRSMHNFNNLVNDSGYGSFEKLRPIDNSILSSPIFTKRSGTQTNLPIPSTNEAGTSASSNERIHINGISHTQNENGSPFHSDSGGDGSPRGSNGFVNLAGTAPSEKPPKANVNANSSVTAASAAPTQNNFRTTMKGTAYDQVRSNRKKKWNDR